ncbi:hypothetical protein LSH36_1127g00054 [Paralvinella palmiformis]|uniref:Luciferin 4-monooxygenase n=1 Tax=Paralvinella palmiformis TaxID=53620 RepID=A0AAD9IUT6_9ANNE|nr:hypothetical protein LSH36_1127g00054 [Paralvinella palmiformis]
MKSPLPDVTIPTEHGLAHVLLDRMQKFGSRTALIDALTHRKLTYVELRQVVLQLAGFLCGHGLTNNHLVLMACQNTIDFPVVFLALSYLGITVSTVNPRAKPGELWRLMLDCEPDYVVVTDTDVKNRIKNVMKEHKNLHIKEIFIVGSGSYPEYLDIEGLLKEEFHSSMCHHQHIIDVRHQVAALLYSSGTTGLPKGVMLSHYNILANIFQISHLVFRSPFAISNQQDTIMASLPFYHVYGLTIIQLCNLFSGNKLVVLPTFNLDTFLSAIEMYKVSFVYLVPPIAIQLIKDPRVSRYNLSSITSLFSGAAPISIELIKQIKKHLHIYDIRQGYGMTETSPGVLHPPLGHVKLGSVGIPLPNTEVKVVDPDTKMSLGSNQNGEIWIRGPQVMIGYHNSPDVSQQSIDSDGWLRSGDIGYYDEEGFFYIAGRLKEIIKYKGYQVSPNEIEAVLLTHPAVADAAVIGIDDEVAGQLPRAYVVPKSNHTPSASDIMQYVARELMEYKKLRGGVEFINQIPRSPSGKVLRQVLHQLVKLNPTSRL